MENGNDWHYHYVLGYLFLSIPLGSGNLGMLSMYGALLLVCCGTGLFKGNLQVMVGNLYDNPQYESKRDSAFSIFYMAINIGALFAPSAAVGIKNWGIEKFHLDAGSAYHFAFGVACLSLILSIAIYYVFRSTFKHVEGKIRLRKWQNSLSRNYLNRKQNLVSWLFAWFLLL